MHWLLRQLTVTKRFLSAFFVSHNNMVSERG